MDNFGSCTYSDICQMLPSPDKCPNYFIQNNIPCNCPFPLGTYNIKSLQIQLPNFPIPSGGYEITANFQNTQGHVGCVQIELNIN